MRNGQSRTSTLNSTATIAACVLAAFCEGFDLQAAGVAAAGIGAEFKPTPEQMGTFFSASTLGLFFGALVGGRLSDSFGRKHTLIVSIALFGVFSISTAQAWDVRILTFARLLTGLGLGGAFPTLVAWVNEHSAPHRRRANVALVYSGMPIGGALVSLMSMLIAPVHWRLIFIAGGIAPLILAPLMYWVLRESPAVSSESSMQDAPMPKTGSFLALFADGRGLSTLLLWTSCFLGLVTVYLMLSWLPTLLVGNGFTQTQAAGAQIAFNVGGALSALLLGQLLEGKLRNPSVIATFIAAPLLVFLLSKASVEFGVVVALAFALGGALLAAQGYFYSAAASAYPTSIRGVGAGATVAAGRLGSVVGPKLGGMIRAAGHSSSQLFSDILPLVILGSITALAFAWITSRSRAPSGTD
jgi:MFS transporter, AAHS family, 3-hydroxyphenylpropionic acid transporter